jgi:hypothetical protein
MFRIYDDVLDEQLLEYVNLTIKNLKWEAGHKSNDEDRTSFFASFPEDVVLYEHIFEIFKKCEPECQQDKIIEIKRFYVNLHPYGTGGEWHIDNDHPNSITFLYYPQKWNPKWKGDTLFKSGERIEYKQNRLGMFYGNDIHKADVHYNPDNRYTIAFKTFVGDSEKWNKNEN